MGPRVVLSDTILWQVLFDRWLRPAAEQRLHTEASRGQLALHAPSIDTVLTPACDCAFPQTQGVCYAGLWHVSGNQPYIEDNSEIQPSLDGQSSSGTGSFAESGTSSDSDPDYSIVAVAGAMYLLLTIAAADVWGGLALCLEGRGSGRFKFFTQRRAFGVLLVGTFIALIGASIRVLFYSSFENVDLVIGAATVLFVADVVSALETTRHISNRLDAEFKRGPH